MEQKLIKKYIPYIVTPLVAIGIFIGGFSFGTWFLASMKSTTFLQDSMFEQMHIISAVKHLDNGDNEKARQSLLMLQDGAILSIDTMASYADKQSYETACNIMQAIALHRKELPDKYSNYMSEFKDIDPPFNTSITAEILAKWESCK